MFRVGLGYDIHRFKKGLPAGRQGRPLWLGGILIKEERGLEGHSDADALLHALIDALLGAAGLPDIGHFFPPGDSKTKNISSAVMLSRAMRELKRLKFRVVNVDSTIITEKPKIAPYRESMRKRMAFLLEIPVSAIQVKGKSNEGLDAIGKGQALAAQVVVLLRKNEP